MKLVEKIKILNDIAPTKELLDYDFTELISNDSYSFLNGYPPIFRKLRTYGMIFFPFEHWENEKIVRSDYKNIVISPSNYSDKEYLHTICMDNVKILEDYYQAIAKNAVLDILPPNEHINEHVDKSIIYTYCHRVHLPIVTNSNVYFYVGGYPYQMPKGIFFEFSNKDLHAVQNFSSKTRIHLVVDLLPKSSLL